MMAGYAHKHAILAMIIASVCYGPARASNYETNYYSIRPGMTPQEMEMHSIKPSHVYCKQGGDKEMVWRRDGEYQFEYDQRGVLTNTIWRLRHKLRYKSDEYFKYMASKSICLKNKDFKFNKMNITTLQGSEFLFRRKAMYAVHESDYPVYYALSPDSESGNGYILYCDRRNIVNITAIADLCAISEVICPYKKSGGGMMGGGSRF